MLPIKAAEEPPHSPAAKRWQSYQGTCRACVVECGAAAPLSINGVTKCQSTPASWMSLLLLWRYNAPDQSGGGTAALSRSRGMAVVSRHMSRLRCGVRRCCAAFDQRGSKLAINSSVLDEFAPVVEV
jgi:hypothetical protein